MDDGLCAVSTRCCRHASADHSFAAGVREISSAAASAPASASGRASSAVPVVSRPVYRSWETPLSVLADGSNTRRPSSYSVRQLHTLPRRRANQRRSLESAASASHIGVAGRNKKPEPHTVIPAPFCLVCRDETQTTLSRRRVYARFARPLAAVLHQQSARRCQYSHRNSCG